MRLGFLILCFISINAFSESFNGSYIVPVDEPRLQEYSVFKLENYKVKLVPGNRTFIYYELPEDLVGVKGIGMSFGEIGNHDATGLRVFASSHGVARCNGKWSEMECRVKLKKVPVEWAETEAFLEEKFGGQPEILEARRAVSLKFQSEPIGLISIHESL